MNVKLVRQHKFKWRENKVMKQLLGHDNRIRDLRSHLLRLKGLKPKAVSNSSVIIAPPEHSLFFDFLFSVPSLAIHYKKEEVTCKTDSKRIPRATKIVS